MDRPASFSSSAFIRVHPRLKSWVGCLSAKVTRPIAFAATLFLARTIFNLKLRQGSSMRFPKLIAELIRWATAKPRLKEPIENKRANLSSNEQENDEYSFVGIFSTYDAERLLDRLKKDGLRFQIDPNPSAGRANINGNIRLRETIGVYIHHDDKIKMERILNELQVDRGGFTSP
jgi:hypothetical protein